MFSWFSFLTYAVVTAVTPGPNTLMSLSNGGRLGWTLEELMDRTLQAQRSCEESVAAQMAALG